MPMAFNNLLVPGLSNPIQHPPELKPTKAFHSAGLSAGVTTWGRLGHLTGSARPPARLKFRLNMVQALLHFIFPLFNGHQLNQQNSILANIAIQSNPYDACPMSHMIPLYIPSPFFHPSHECIHHHKATNPLLSPKRLISIPIGQSSVPLACFITLPPAAQITNSPPIKGGPTSNHDVRDSSPASFQELGPYFLSQPFCLLLYPTVTSTLLCSSSRIITTTHMYPSVTDKVNHVTVPQLPIQVPSKISPQM
ncbi:hypothetical protein J3E69DRAFT_119070 [Trichoderma sp. SZMC 28015]